MGRFYNCGQACLAIKRLYVFESVADEIIEAVAAKAKRLRVGVGSDPDSQLGPLHTEGQREELERQIAESGGEIVAGGGRPDGLDDRLVPRADGRRRAGQDSPMAREEVFGPALPIWRVRDMDEAIELANDSPFGLGSSVWTRDLERAERAAAELDCRLHVDQLAHEGLRRAALRRPEGERLRQGARLRGARLLHGPEVGGGGALNVDELVAIDVHSHVQASLTSRGFPPDSPEAAVAEVFGSRHAAQRARSWPRSTASGTWPPCVSWSTPCGGADR